MGAYPRIIGGIMSTVLTQIGNRTPKGYQQIIDVSSAVGLTVPTGSKIARIDTQAQAVRWRDDGTNPIATVGKRLLVTDTGFVYDGDLSAIRFFEEAASAVLNISYYA